MSTYIYVSVAIVIALALVASWLVGVVRLLGYSRRIDASLDRLYRLHYDPLVKAALQTSESVDPRITAALEAREKWLGDQGGAKDE